MIVLALDPGASTGYALVKVDKDTSSADIFKYGFLDVDKSSDYQGDHCLNLMNQVSDIIEEHGVDFVCIEDYFFSKRFANGSDVNAAYRTAIHIRCREVGVAYEILNISLWKKHVAGASTPSKEDKKKWGKDAAKKLYMQRALFVNYGIRFPNHSLSTRTNKPVFFRFDVVDVVAQAIYYAQAFLGIETITCSVEVPPDVEFNRPNKKVFVYN